MRLVEGVFCMAKRWGWSVKRYSNIIGFLFQQGFHEHGSKTKSGVYRLTCTRREIFRYCVESSMDNRMPINQNELFSFHLCCHHKILTPLSIPSHTPES